MSLIGSCAKVRDVLVARRDLLLVFLVFSFFYLFLAWIVSGPGRWWIIDYIGNSNVFYGDDAYRFFLARSAWINPSLYTYNFALPGFLILDGTVISLAGGDLFVSRCLHGVLAAVELCLLWDVARHLGVRRWIMAPAIIVMGLLPRFALMSLSFYGEVWLGFTLCLLLWLFVRRHFMVMAIVVGFLPLIRPEGLFFLVALGGFFLSERRWKEAVLTILPGFLYFIFLYFSFDTLEDYWYWRQELRLILNKLVVNSSNWNISESYSAFFTVPALMGLLYRPVRRLWPFLVPAFVWVVWLQIEFLRGAMTFEDRYVYLLIPLLTLLWASFFAWLWSSVPDAALSPTVKSMILVIGFLLTVTAQLAQVHQLKINMQYNGLSWTLKRVWKGEWDRLFPSYAPEHVYAWKSLDARMQELLEKDRGIDKVVIFDHVLYYYLDPHTIPSNVVVGYPSSGYAVFLLLLNGHAFIQHPGGSMYSYLEYGKPDFRKGERRVLYADLMPMHGYPYKWESSGYQLYLFSYLESFRSPTDLSQAPMLTPEFVDGLYRQWFN